MEEAVEERGRVFELKMGEGLRRRTRSRMEFSDQALGRRELLGGWRKKKS